MDPEYSGWCEAADTAAKARQVFSNQLGSKTAVELLELLMNDTVIEHLLTDILQYAHDV